MSKLYLCLVFSQEIIRNRNSKNIILCLFSFSPDIWYNLKEKNYQFLSIYQFGIILWGNSTNTKMVFTLQKTAIRKIMSFYAYRVQTTVQKFVYTLCYPYIFMKPWYILKQIQICFHTRNKEDLFVIFCNTNLLSMCACPSVISSIPGKSFHFPFP